jgi:hypothetical protein
MALKIYLFIFKSTIFVYYAVFRFVSLRFLSLVFVSFRFNCVSFRFNCISFRWVVFSISFLTLIQPKCQATTKAFCVLKMKFLFSKFHQDRLIGDIGSNLLLLYPRFHISSHYYSRNIQVMGGSRSRTSITSV